MDNKIRIKAGLIFGIAITIFFILQDPLRNDNLTKKNIVITVGSGLFGGALAGLVFGWLMGLFANSKLLRQGTKSVIDSDETILLETGANHFKGIEGVGGKLCLTDKRLVFKSHKFNIQNHELQIRLSDIDKVERYKTLGMMNNGLSVATKDNKIERFAVQQIDKWISKLTEMKT